jgi:hypothetical protein
VILAFNGTTWVSTGVTIWVYDDYYNAPGFFTGTANYDRGWARFRKKGTGGNPDQYELVWMSGPAHVVRFTLTADRSSGAPDEALNATINQYFLYGNDRLQRTTIYFRADMYPRALTGAKGYAVYNDFDDHYEAVVCDQQGTHATALLTQDACGTSVSIEDFTISSFWPFSLAPDPLPTTALNINAHCGRSGDIVKLVWLEYLEEWDVYDVTKHQVEVPIGQRITVATDGTCTEEWQWQQACIELCQDPEWREVAYCCCDGTPPPNPPCDDGGWYYLEFYDQTGDCTCLPDTPIGGGSAWTTSTCPGNTTYTLNCVSGGWTLTVGGVGDATLISYTPGVEMLFQLPAMGVLCGGAGGTAKVRITKGP